MPDTIAIALLAAELDQPVSALASRLAEHVTIDRIGVRVVDLDVAAQLLSERSIRQQAAQQSRQHAHEQARAADTTRASRTRVRAIAEEQARSRGEGHSDDLPALAVLKRVDLQSDWDAAATLRDELTTSERSGRLQYHPIQRSD